jgi:hypothetical protein
MAPFSVKDLIHIVESYDFVMLKKFNMIDTKTLEGLVDLAAGFLLRTSVDFRHHERLSTVAIFQCSPQADLALAVVVIP